MDLELTGKTAIVTGAGKGIGLAVCEALAAEGARVVANVRSPSRALERLAVDVELTTVQGDITEGATRQRLVDAAGPAVDILVNNAGIAPARPRGFLHIEPRDWGATFQLDLHAGVAMIRAVLPAMLERRFGSVVNIGSLNARLPDPLVIDYSAAKAALGSVTKSLSKEYAAQGVRFNTVDPGPVATDLWNGDDGVAQTVARAEGIPVDDVHARATAGIPTGRFSTPDEVATLVVLLCSPRTINVTGASLVVDGGMEPTL